MPSLFPTTRRSVVFALRSADAAERERAFDTLVAVYWKPLYKFARLTWGRSPEDAEDLTQSFFTRMLQGDTLAAFDPQKAAFRSYLRMLFERQTANEVAAASRLKRGGEALHVELAEAEAELDGEVRTPEELFERDWIRSVFTVAVARARQTLTDTQYAMFEAYDLSDDSRVSYRDLAQRFALPESTVTNHLAAARRRFREAVLDTLREATASDAEFRAEARALLGVDR